MGVLDDKWSSTQQEGWTNKAGFSKTQIQTGFDVYSQLRVMHKIENKQIPSTSIRHGQPCKTKSVSKIGLGWACTSKIIIDMSKVGSYRAMTNARYIANSYC
jgi:hypothetical protein